MKDVFIAQGWNLGLVVLTIFLGWYFSYEIGKFLDSLSGGGGHWVDARQAVGVIFGIPILATLVLSTFGSRWWFLGVILICLPLLWLTISSQEIGMWLILVIYIFTPVAIGLLVRKFTKKYIPGTNP